LRILQSAFPIQLLGKNGLPKSKNIYRCSRLCNNKACRLPLLRRLKVCKSLVQRRRHYYEGDFLEIMGFFASATLWSLRQRLYRSRTRALQLSSLATNFSLWEQPGNLFLLLTRSLTLRSVPSKERMLSKLSHF
jgi:hypothetical protein